MKKFALLLLVVFIMMTLVVSGCVGSDGGKKASDDVKKTGESNEKTSIFNPTGYPIVNEKITLKVFMTSGEFYGNANEMTYFKKLEELTNIHLEFEHVTQNSGERVNLLFASQDYPDIMFRGANDRHILNTAAAGDIIPLTELINKYAPNWKKFFEQYSYGKKVATMPDGEIWSLPIVRMEDSNAGIRDQWMINVKWLRELGLEMPKTTDDFYNVLKSFKENAGKGSIPQEVIPWMFMYNAYSNGGQYELYNAFGAFTPGKPHYISVDENGKVVFSATDPTIKEPIKFLRRLYVEGLIPPEVFTDDSAAYTSKILSNPPIVGTYLRYFNDDPTEEIYDVMPPLQGPHGGKPMYRQQTNAVERNFFTIFTKNPYPEASIRLADTIGEPDWSVQAMYGMYGEWMEKDGDRIIQLPFVGNEAYENVPGNNVAFLLTPEAVEKIEYSGSQAQRDKNVKEVYKPYVVPIERFYPPVVWREDQTAALQDIETDLLEYVNSTIAHWIVDGGIDEEWDEYVRKVESLKLDDLIEIYQEALDVFNKN